MRISARCDYACKAILELALHWPSREPMHVEEISKNQGIPIKYLVQILIQLKRLGFVESTRGKQGGYVLVKEPKFIKFGNIIREICGPLLPLAKSAAKKESIFVNIWKEVESAMAEILDKVTFDDVLNKAKGKEKTIFYQI